MRSFVGNGVRTLMIRALPGGEESPYFEQAFAAFREYYAAHCRDHTRAYPQIPELLNELSARGVKLGIVSNKSDKEGQGAESRLLRRTLPRRPRRTPPACARKPEPDSLLEAMKELWRR